MRYIDVLWNHTNSNEPYRLISEVNEEGYELRKIEKFKDGRVGYANNKLSTNSTELADQIIPSNDEIRTMKEFKLREMDKDEFDRLWGKVVLS